MTSRERFERWMRSKNQFVTDNMNICSAFPFSWAAWSARDPEVKRLVEALRDWKRAQDYAAQYGHLSDAAQAITDAFADAEAKRDTLLKEYADE